MRFLYQFGINSYWFLIRVFSLFKPKAKLFIEGRKAWRKNLKAKRNDRDKYLWVHCASLGEFEQGRPFIETIKKKYPDYKICLTFFSPSGYEIRKNYEYADIVCYLPKDNRINARDFLHILQPELAVFIKYEFWFHFLNELSRQNIPTYLISAIFREDQVFFKWYGKFFRHMLRQYDFIFIQDKASEDRLRSLNLDRIGVSGDTRFDRVWEITHQPFTDNRIETFAGNDFCMVAGSTWTQDESVLLELLGKNKDVKLILAPHETDEQHVNQIITRFREFNPVLYTDKEVNDPNSRILIINTIGLLSGLYRFGKIAYIGGGFGKGIHNTLEAACYGIPVIFGPNYQKFKEAIDLIDCQAGFSISSVQELIDRIDYLTKDERLYTHGKYALDYVEKKRGATQKILTQLQKSDVF